MLASGVSEEETEGAAVVMCLQTDLELQVGCATAFELRECFAEIEGGGGRSSIQAQDLLQFDSSAGLWTSCFAQGCDQGSREGAGFKDQPRMEEVDGHDGWRLFTVDPKSEG